MPSQQVNIIDNIVSILGQGCFLTREVRFNKGKLQEGFSMASTLLKDGSKLWFMIKFEEQESRSLTITLGKGKSLGEEVRGYGHVFISHGQPIHSFGYGPSDEAAVRDDFLTCFPHAQFDPQLNLQLIQQYKGLPDNSVYHWEVFPGYLQFDGQKYHFTSEGLKKRGERI